MISKSTTDFQALLSERIRLVDSYLDDYLPSETDHPASIHRAMRYSLFAGGKRLRPILVLGAAEVCGGELEGVLPQAAAVEMIHTYSLIHDDLPCMDDDDLRRGRPTSHKVFGEGMAVLAGDALLTEAFCVIGQASSNPRYHQGHFLAELSEAASSRQLIGGQVLDLEGEQREIDYQGLKDIHLRKTAALITCSLRLGAMGAAATPQELAALTQFGQSLGLAFQILDDILDVTQSSEELGKTAGKDEATSKSTYPALLGLAQAQAEAGQLTKQAMESLDLFEDRAHWLRDLAGHLLKRTN